MYWKEPWKKIHLILISMLKDKSIPWNHNGEPAGAVHKRRISKQWIILWKEQHILCLHNSDFIVGIIQSSKIHFYTVEESTKEIFIGTKILAAEFSVFSILRWPLVISSILFCKKSHS